MVRHPTDPITSGERQHPRISLAILQSILQGDNIFSGLDMTATATIRFARPGVRAPVFVVTSASTPPWALVEMLDSGDRTASGEIIFERTFDDVSQGAHQYKIRIGHDQWILEEDKEIATDESGNRNNVVHSELKFNHTVSPIPDQVPGPVSRSPDAAMQAKPNTTHQGQTGKDDQEPERREHRQDSAQLSHTPVSTAAIKLGEQSPAANGNERQNLEVSTPASAVGFGRNKSVRSEPHVEPGTEEQRRVPLFSHEYSGSEVVAPDLPEKSPRRAIEEESNQSSTDQTGSEVGIITSPEDEFNDPHLPQELQQQQGSPRDELDNAPRLPHETGPDARSGSSIGDDDELSSAPLMSHEAGPSADCPGGEAVTDELSNAPLFSHEAETSAASPTISKPGGVERGPLMAPETDGTYDESGDSGSPSGALSGFGSTPSSPSESDFASPRIGGRDTRRHLSPEQKAILRRRRRGMVIETSSVSSGDGASELDRAPLLSHEADLSPQTGSSNDSAGELDRAPMMSHEANTDDAVNELDRAPVLPHEADLSRGRSEDASTAGDSGVASAFSRGMAASMDDGDNDEAPLLPHERPSPVRETSNGELFRETGQLPVMTYRGPNSPPVFVRHTASSLWKARSNSSSLPHSLPRSDEEDENLNDPSLEPFPTARQHIFERVATISQHLPEDETMPSPSGLHSPAIMSQACSSVDLVPVGSHSSLQRINEDVVMEGDEDGEEDVALGSPVMELSFRTNAGSAPAPTDDFVIDDFPTPMPQRRRGNYFGPDNDEQDQGQEQVGDREQQFGSSEADERTLVGSVYGHDGASERDSSAPSARRRWTPDALAQPARPLNPVLTNPTIPQRRQIFPWEFVDEQNEIDLQTALVNTPPQQRVYRSPLYLRAWRRLFAQHGFLSVAAVCGALAAAVWSWWWFRGGSLYG